MPQRKTKTSFKKGNKAGAKKTLAKKGTPTYNRDELLAKKIDKVTITNYLTLNSHLTVHELIKRLETEKVSVLEAMLIKGMIKAYRTGDVYQMNFFLERLVGKVPNQVEHTVNNPYKDMSDEELLAEKKRVSEINRRNMTWNEQNNQRMIQQLEEASVIEATTGDDSTGD